MLARCQGVNEVETWLQDVTAEPPEPEAVVAHLMARFGARARWWNLKVTTALAVSVLMLLDMRKMLVTQKAAIDKLLPELEEAYKIKKGAITHALDAQTAVAVMKHRLAVTEEVAQAACSGNPERMYKAVARYRALNEAFS